MVTGETPATMLLKRTPRTRLSLLYLNVAESVEKHQQNQKKYHDSPHHKLREFKVNDAVQIQNFHREKRNGKVVLLQNAQDP